MGPTSKRSWNTPTKLSSQDERKASPSLSVSSGRYENGRTKDVTLIERVPRAATKMVAGFKSVDYETCPAVLDLFPQGYPRPRGDLILTYAPIKQGLANGLFNIDPANTRRGHNEKIFKLRRNVFSLRVVAA
ncbi:hypothetical protein T265_09320 [Opisthorchis viverrini]|uniref:Uncharacterized protein n=1 Tax=Opisthorchis viverrini TaxID=6198 RepID=A0A074Z6A8_OPIVI|nr:hypothetical protein T265_09320 [Opisthorchis viverrini]KER22613.1 hypothetical protein T265_09320 [Opisthorchis viverrini]